VRTVRVATAPPCEVRIGRGLLGDADEATARHSARAVLSDRNVAPLHAGALPGAPLLAIEPGERSKTLATLEQVLDSMAEAGLDRGSCLVALGGGVVGDLGGLAASLYMRGIAFVQAPTSLLAQVDAAIGGKTAVNLRAGRNLAGTFHQPILVVADVDTLATLPDPEYRSGLGEVVKSALIEGEEALAGLERVAPSLLRRDPDLLVEIVAGCVSNKARLVAADPRDEGPRQVLNLGHTFAHAIETAAGFGTVPHGCAVAAGLLLSARLSAAAGVLEDVSLTARIEALLRALELPVAPPGLDRDAVLAAMRLDKKSASGRPRFVLPAAAGRVRTGIEVDPALVVGLLRPG